MVHAISPDESIGIGLLPKIFLCGLKSLVKTYAPLFKMFAVECSDVSFRVIGQSDLQSPGNRLDQILLQSISIAAAALHELNQAEVHGIADDGHEAGFYRGEVSGDRRKIRDGSRCGNEL